MQPERADEKAATHQKLSPNEIKTIRTLLKTSDMPVAEIAARFGISRSTLYHTILPPMDRQR
jgi:DNA-binding transcriptional regulator YiaG